MEKQGYSLCWIKCDAVRAEFEEKERVKSGIVCLQYGVIQSA